MLHIFYVLTKEDSFLKDQFQQDLIAFLLKLIRNYLLIIFSINDLSVYETFKIFSISEDSKSDQIELLGLMQNKHSIP